MSTQKTKTDVWSELKKMNECTKVTIEAVVPKKKKKFKNGREMSAETVKLHEERIKAFSKKKPDAKERKRWNKKISRHCRKDYRKWVTRWTEKIEKEFRAGNAKTIYEGVKALRGTKK